MTANVFRDYRAVAKQIDTFRERTIYRLDKARRELTYAAHALASGEVENKCRAADELICQACRAVAIALGGAPDGEDRERDD
jgi:hypothetical protein